MHPLNQLFESLGTLVEQHERNAYVEAVKNTLKSIEFLMNPYQVSQSVEYFEQLVIWRKHGGALPHFNLRRKNERRRRVS
jgi:hypothetical protein